MNNTLKISFVLGNLVFCVVANSIPAFARTSSWENTSASSNRFDDRQIEEDRNFERNSSSKPSNLIDLGGVSSYPKDIVPARGMILNEKGQVVLTGYPTPNVPDRPATQLFNCNDLNK
jgi:hypothetical protein